MVRDGERANGVDLVAEELHAQRVFLGRREDVEDAAPDGEFAALFHEVDAGVGQPRQCRRQLGKIGFTGLGEPHRFKVPQPFELRLKHAAHRRHDDAKRFALGVRQAVKYGQAFTDGVAAR